MGDYSGIRLVRLRTCLLRRSDLLHLVAGLCVWDQHRLGPAGSSPVDFRHCRVRCGLPACAGSQVPMVSWLRGIDWTDLWDAAAVALFMLALVIWADYAGDLVSGRC